MQAVRIFKYKNSDKCHKSIEKSLQQRDVDMAARCGEMEFSLDGEEGDERVENVPTFQYLVQPLEQMDDDWPSVRRNIMQAMSV